MPSSMRLKNYFSAGSTQHSDAGYLGDAVSGQKKPSNEAGSLSVSNAPTCMSRRVRKREYDEISNLEEEKSEECGQRPASHYVGWLGLIMASMFIKGNQYDAYS